MKCPSCAHEDTKVVDSREANDGLSIRRRRECEKCASRFSTYEELEILELMVEKRDGRAEPYTRDTLESGIRKALEKRPVERDDYKRLISEIEQEIQKKREDGKIESREIGRITMKKLKEFDLVAYLRFTSVCQQFENITEFKKALQKL